MSLLTPPPLTCVRRWSAKMWKTWSFPTSVLPEWPGGDAASARGAPGLPARLPPVERCSPFLERGSTGSQGILLQATICAGLAKTAAWPKARPLRQSLNPKGRNQNDSPYRRDFLKVSAMAAGALAANLCSAHVIQSRHPNSPSLQNHQACTCIRKCSRHRARHLSRTGGLGHNPQATVWDGLSDFWWNEKFTDQNLVNEMFSHSLRQLTASPATRLPGRRCSRISRPSAVNRRVSTRRENRHQSQLNGSKSHSG